MAVMKFVRVTKLIGTSIGTVRHVHIESPKFLTANGHVVRTPDGWVKVGDLKEGDEIAVVMVTDPATPEEKT
jgi:hypothetical protein